MVEDENGRSIEVTPLDFLEAVYCNPNLPLATRLRAAIEAAPYKHPKLSAAAIGHFDGQTFAEALDRAISRSQQPVPLLNGPSPELPAEELKGPFPNYRNNYRRY
jgi:hypothetical protein